MYNHCFVTMPLAVTIFTYVDFLPPKFNVNCHTNGNVMLHWSLQSSGSLSTDYIDSFVKSWSFTGSCKNQQGDVYQVKSQLLSDIFMILSYFLSNIVLNIIAT